MRENLSRRAWFVVLKSLLAARRQGHDSIEANDLVTGIIVEDQDPHSLELDEQHPSVKRAREMNPQPKGVLFPLECWIAREPFLPNEIAVSVLQGLKAELIGLDDAPGKNGLPPSIEVDRILDTAEQLRNEFHHSKIEPLHILAAALCEPCEASRILKEAGITEDRVRGALKRPGAAE